MLKTMMGRKGKEGELFFALCGCRLSPADNFSYEFENEGAFVHFEGQLEKGSSVITLPTPVLNPNILLLVAPHPELLKVGKVEMPLTIFGKTTVTGNIIIRVTIKEALQYAGPLATYYIIGAR